MKINGCCGLNESAPPYTLTYLRVFFVFDGTVWKGLGGVALLEELCHQGVDFEALKNLSHSQIATFLASGCVSTLSALCLPAAVLATVLVIELSSKIVIKPPVKYNFLF